MVNGKMNPLKALLDIIYPPRCPVCQVFLSGTHNGGGNNPAPFCPDCYSGFNEITPPLCPVCGTPFLSPAQDDHLCEECLRKRPTYEAKRALYAYQGPLMEAIHQFKYGGKSYLAHSLGSILARFAGEWLGESHGLIAMPVPLHPKKLRERGFNQSLLLARHVARRLNAELDFLSLRRVRYTPPQTGLAKDERRKNVRKAFEVIRPEAVKGKRVLLVDDVSTTGSTLAECSRVIKRAGAKDVWCLALARTVRTL